ncbi:PilZ domain-containing protein [Romboutsia sp.]|uniref:flagellar brake protein n=1 Tax=Romboutsia sp. TaxID=1965302 RepID=UPI002CE60CDF|nr:PilZ domain-containing protein [Romboutsia sp.]HSQ90324.1 PilZ domain-containing protein [Romboutsia sp.]
MKKGNKVIFNLFKEKFLKYKERSIEESVSKYAKILDDDIDLKIHISYHNKMYTTYVESLHNREVVFRCPIDEENIIRYNLGKIIEIEFISYTGLYITEICITERIIKDDIMYYKGNINSPIEKKQRRDNFRLPINLDVTYTLPLNEARLYSGNTKDISVGGMLMENNEHLYVNKKLKITFELDNKVYRVKSTIINKRTNFVNGKYLYHIRFDDLNNKQKREIYRFILDEQKVELRRNAGIR